MWLSSKEFEFFLHRALGSLGSHGTRTKKRQKWDTLVSLTLRAKDVEFHKKLDMFLLYRAVFIWMSKSNWFCTFYATWLAGDVKEPTHLSERVGHVVPGVVVYLNFHPTFHAWAGWVSEIKYELIVAARGTFKLTFDLTQKELQTAMRRYVIFAVYKYAFIHSFIHSSLEVVENI